MKAKQILWLSLLAIVCGVPLVYLFLNQPVAVPFWAVLIAVAILASFARSFILRHEGYVDELRKHVASRGFEVVSSRPLGWLSTGTFPNVHVFSQPYVRTDTPIGSGEFVQYRRVVLRDAHGRQFRTCALLEFKGFRCARVEFKPDLGSLSSKWKRRDERKKKRR